MFVKNDRKIEVGQVRENPYGELYVVLEIGASVTQVLLLNGKFKGQKSCWDNKYFGEDIVVM